MPIPTPPPFPVNPFMDGTAGILLAYNDIYQWAASVVFGDLFCEPPSLMMATGCLPSEQENILSVILLPV